MKLFNRQMVNNTKLDTKTLMAKRLIRARKIWLAVLACLAIIGIFSIAVLPKPAQAEPPASVISSDDIDKTLEKYRTYTQLKECLESMKGIARDIKPNQVFGGADNQHHIYDWGVEGEMSRSNLPGEIDPVYWKLLDRSVECSYSTVAVMTRDLTGKPVDANEISRAVRLAAKKADQNCDDNQTDDNCWNTINRDKARKIIASFTLDKVSKPRFDGVIQYRLYKNQLNKCHGESWPKSSNHPHTGKIVCFKRPTPDKDHPGKLKIEDACATPNYDMDKHGFTVLPTDSSSAVTCSELVNKVNLFVGNFVENHNRGVDLGLIEASNQTAQEAVEQDEQSTNGPETDEPSRCEAGLLGFGWLFCPGSTILESYMNGMLGWIDDSFEWTVLVGKSGEGALKAWSSFLTMANIMFAIAFLFMIYSMATSATSISSSGLSAYNIRKMLPRLIVVAIAINISFYLCAAAVDISNIAGKAAYKIMAQENNTTFKITGQGERDGQHKTTIWDKLGDIIVVVMAAIMFMSTILMGLLFIFIIIILRQVALFTLIAVSPLAISLYLLPNTAKYFKTWWNWFFKLLLMYPAFGAVWGVSKFLSNNFEQATGESGKSLQYFARLIFMVMPALAVVPIFRMAGGAISAITGRVSQGLNRTGLARAGNRMTRGAARGVGRAVTAPAMRGAGRMVTKAANTRLAGWLGTRSVVGGAIARRTGQMAVAGMNPTTKMDENAMANAAKNIKNFDYDQKRSMAVSGMYLDAKGNKHRVDDYTRRAAMAEVGKTLQDGDVATMMASVNAQTDGKNSYAAQQLRGAAANAARESDFMATPKFIGQFEKGDIKQEVFGEEMATAVASKVSNTPAEKMASLSEIQARFANEQINSAQAAGQTLVNSSDPGTKERGEVLVNAAQAARTNVGANVKSIDNNARLRGRVNESTLNIWRNTATGGFNPTQVSNHNNGQTASVPTPAQTQAAQNNTTANGTAGPATGAGSANATNGAAPQPGNQFGTQGGTT